MDEPVLTFGGLTLRLLSFTGHSEYHGKYPDIYEILITIEEGSFSGRVYTLMPIGTLVELYEQFADLDRRVGQAVDTTFNFNFGEWHDPLDPQLRFYFRLTPTGDFGLRAELCADASCESRISTYCYVDQTWIRLWMADLRRLLSWFLWEFSP